MQRQVLYKEFPSALTGHITAIDPSTNTFTVDITLPDRTNDGDPADDYAGWTIVPNTNYITINYKIQSNTSNTITVTTPIDTARVSPGVTFGILYGKYIRDIIYTPHSGPKSVKFYETEKGPHSYVNNDKLALNQQDSTPDGICQVCHTRTKRSTNDGKGFGDGHGTDTSENCQSCHDHANNGFGSNCNSCHGYPPVDDATLVFKDAQGSSVNSSSQGNSPGAGAHNSHIGAGLSCVNCHSGGMLGGANEGNDLIDIGFSLNGNSLGGSYDAQDGSLKTVFPLQGNGGTTINNTGSFTCSNIYCHSSVQADGGDAGPDTFGTPVWNDLTSVGCDSCHGQAGEGDGQPQTGSHHAHASSATNDFPCSTCHKDAGSGTSLHVNGIIDIAIDDTYGGSYSQGSHAPGSGGYGSCSSVYCHGTGTPQWGGTVSCGDCHPANNTLAGRHPTHYTSSTTATDRTARNDSTQTAYQFNCGVCHYNALHSRGPVSAEQTAEVIFDPVIAGGGTYTLGAAQGADPASGFNWTGGECSNIYCHSDARGGPPNRSVHWSDPDSPGHAPCDSCHNGRTGRESLVMSSNGHDRLVGDNWVRKYPCYYCHNDTVDTQSEIKDFSKHVNGVKDVAIAPEWNIPGYPDPSYDPQTKTCKNIYCHSDGTVVSGSLGPEVRDFAWDSGEHTKCNTCHGHPRGSCPDCHSDGRTGWPPGEEWKEAVPMYQNTGPGTARANSHPRHLQTGFPCDECHYLTIVNGTCTDCHVDSIPPGSMGEVAHINAQYHVNKRKDVYFKQGGTYNPTDKTCTATACHNGATPQWGDSVNGNVICLTCHGTTDPDVDDFDIFNGTQARINMVEWEESGHGRPASKGNYPSGNPPANFPGNPCWYCHDNKVVHGDSTNPFRLKIHPQFERRFEKECVYCHMEGKDYECMGCHNDPESLAPQLSSITSPPFSQDHTGYVDGQTSCVSSCHATDEQRHNTGAGLWTPEQKDDVKNQYVMMGVCLQCHDDDSNGRCQMCHQGDKYKLGYDPGTGFVTAQKARATSVHFGYKHYGEYQNNGVWKGGKFCWDCHDPHGDSNIYMIQDQVSTETDGKFGIPTKRASVKFTKKQSGMDYARVSAPYDGICNVCHTDPDQHYQANYGDGHNLGRICTECHEHRFTDSHASGKPCNTCHLNKPVPRHSGFSLPRDCTKCHRGVVYKRKNIMGQFSAPSHHVQGDTVTNKHCYACHWEATEIGLINTDYHQGYNYKTHESTHDGPVDLVIWGPGERPTTYEIGNTAVQFTAQKVGTSEERTEVGKVTQHCLGCHSDQNNDTRPFALVDPDNPDCNTPRQYAWDRTSIAARYNQTGTTTWGKYTTEPKAAPKNIQKAYSAHGNAVANEGGWDPNTGLDGSIPNTRAGTENVQCFDCHNSHGSRVQGVTSSYVTFNGTHNGANLKETQAGKGGYEMSYMPEANQTPGAVNPYEAGADLCFDCHETPDAGATPWGYQSTFGATEPIIAYKDSSRFGSSNPAMKQRYTYRSGRQTMGGHLKASSPLSHTPQGQINGICTGCHDPHGVSPALGDKQPYAVPLLKGTWLTSPYKEDGPNTRRGNSGYDPYNGSINWHTDRNTFGGNRIKEDVTEFAGLCLNCHPKDALTDGIDHNTPFKTKDRIHESVKGWGPNTEHSWPCSKCHQPHSSGLPRLMQTNCLDYNHFNQVASGGTADCYTSRSGYPNGKLNSSCHGDTTCSNSIPVNPDSQKWNDVTPW
jgi:predicted CxxxxCH...CXXCH cytochrome family protein